jgi:hypothetical protein
MGSWATERCGLQQVQLASAAPCVFARADPELGVKLEEALEPVTDRAA